MVIKQKNASSDGFLSSVSPQLISLEKGSSEVSLLNKKFQHEKCESNFRGFCLALMENICLPRPHSLSSVPLIALDGCKIFFEGPLIDIRLTLHVALAFISEEKNINTPSVFLTMNLCCV